MIAFFTFTTYGTHLHGTEKESISRQNRNWAAPRIPFNEAWKNQARKLMVEPEFILDANDRELVLTSILQTCKYRNWPLVCTHIRTNHVHTILQPSVPANQALIYLKAKATAALKTNHPNRQHFWTKHGSTKYLWTDQSLTTATDYVLNQQGPPMQIWPNPDTAHSEP